MAGSEGSDAPINYNMRGYRTMASYGANNLYGNYGVRNSFAHRNGGLGNGGGGGMTATGNGATGGDSDGLGETAVGSANSLDYDYGSVVGGNSGIVGGAASGNINSLSNNPSNRRLVGGIGISGYGTTGIGGAGAGYGGMGFGGGMGIGGRAGNLGGNGLYGGLNGLAAAGGVDRSSGYGHSGGGGGGYGHGGGYTPINVLGSGYGSAVCEDEGLNPALVLATLVGSAVAFAVLFRQVTLGRRKRNFGGSAAESINDGFNNIIELFSDYAWKGKNFELTNTVIVIWNNGSYFLQF